MKNNEKFYIWGTMFFKIIVLSLAWGLIFSIILLIAGPNIAASVIFGIIWIIIFCQILYVGYKELKGKNNDWNKC